MVAYAGVLGRHFLENKVKLSLERQKAAGVLLSVAEFCNCSCFVETVSSFPTK